MVKKRVTPKWQNLIQGKCPTCDLKLKRDGKVYACDRCHYYITPKKMLEWIGDPKSLIWQNLSPTERRTAKEMMFGK